MSSNSYQDYIWKHLQVLETDLQLFDFIMVLFVNIFDIIYLVEFMFILSPWFLNWKLSDCSNNLRIQHTHTHTNTHHATHKYKYAYLYPCSGGGDVNSPPFLCFFISSKVLDWGFPKELILCQILKCSNPIYLCNLNA